jgi:hypothetical protein
MSSGSDATFSSGLISIIPFDISLLLARAFPFWRDADTVGMIVVSTHTIYT